jgi:hypothetical protein
MSHRWRVVLLRVKAQVFGTVEATDAESVKAAAAVQFELEEVRRQRTIMQEWREPGWVTASHFTLFRIGST